MKKINVNNLKVDELLYKFINEEVIPGTNINPNNFWDGFDKAVHYLSPINKKLIDEIILIKKFLLILGNIIQVQDLKLTE